MGCCGGSGCCDGRRDCGGIDGAASGSEIVLTDVCRDTCRSLLGLCTVGGCIGTSLWVEDEGRFGRSSVSPAAAGGAPSSEELEEELEDEDDEVELS